MPTALYAVLPAYLTISALIFFGKRAFAVDFHRQYWVAGNRVLDGLSPYDLSWQNLKGGVGFGYSALDALLFVPFALLPHTAADWTFTFLDIAAALATLWLLDVRDWRVYGVALMGAPVVSAWQTANITLLLGLGIAAAWRYRDRPVIAGALVALIASMKLFVWPIGVWLVATKRYTALMWAVLAGAVLNLVAWAVIGFDQFAAYTRLSHTIARMDDDRSYNLIALGVNHGVAQRPAYGVQLFAAGMILLACIYVGRRGRDAGALILAVAGCLVAAPVIWLHYFALLLVPLALGRPRLSGVWALPILLWVCPVHEPAAWQLGAAFAVTAGVVVSTLRGCSARTQPAATAIDLSSASADAPAA